MIELLADRALDVIDAPAAAITAAPNPIPIERLDCGSGIGTIDNMVAVLIHLANLLCQLDETLEDKVSTN